MQRMLQRVRICVLIVTACVSGRWTSAAAEVSFRRDVMPVLFRAGCNSGTCHGSARGQDGFHLSLFGYDPAGDYFRISQEMIGRRVNVAKPEQSLLLKKATGSVPHTGGRRFNEDSQYYRTLLKWIEAGALDDRNDVPDTVGIELSREAILFDDTKAAAQLRVTEISSDGSRRDVTSLARFHSNNGSVATIDSAGRVSAAGAGDTNVFARFSRFTLGAEVIVLPSKKGFTWPNPPVVNYIDEAVFDRLKNLRIAPSDLCDDETFLRRVTLDLTGRPPTPAEYASFMSDDTADKRVRKIDQLVESDEFANLWTSLWAEQLRIKGGNYAPVGTHIKAADSFYSWIRSQLRNDRPLNEFVSDMVTASGSNLINGPSNLYTMMVHAPRFQPKPFAADFSQVFLGVQIQCAECHNHPFDRWTMNDYYGFVSFFTGMKRKPGVEPREQRIYCDASAPPARHLLDQRPMPAKILGEVEPVSHNGDPRPALAAWLTSPENEMFSRNLANRIWSHFLGRGVIEPVDDVRVSNPPSNPRLLSALSEHLVTDNFSLRKLARDICRSRVYQLSSQPNDSNRLDTRQFSHARLRRLRADVLMDSVVAATGVTRRFNGFPEGTRAVDVYPRVAGDTSRPQFGDQFFETFGRSGRASVCACETKKEPTLSQAMHLSVGNTIDPRLTGSRIKDLMAAEDSPAKVIQGLFVVTLCRQPTADESRALVALVQGDDDALSAYQDIFWALLNSTEFAFNR